VTGCTDRARGPKFMVTKVKNGEGRGSWSVRAVFVCVSGCVLRSLSREISVAQRCYNGDVTIWKKIKFRLFLKKKRNHLDRLSRNLSKFMKSKSGRNLSIMIWRPSWQKGEMLLF